MRYRIISPHLIIKTGIALFVLVTFPFVQLCYANDSAAEIATGGIQFKNFGDVDSYGALYLNEKWDVRTGPKRSCRTCLTIVRVLKPGVSKT